MKFKILDAAAVLVSVSVFLLFLFYGANRNSEEGYLLIKDEQGESLYSLEEDRRITVHGPVGESVIIIENGAAGFESSDCRDKLCVLMGTVDDGGEWAACLPNRVFISVEGAAENDEADTLSY